jgi:hypothetical protein
MDRHTNHERRGRRRAGPSPFAPTAYSIMGRVAAAMRDAGIDQKEIDDYLARAIASDYDNLLKVSEETVDISFS